MYSSCSQSSATPESTGLNACPFLWTFRLFWRIVEKYSMCSHALEQVPAFIQEVPCLFLFLCFFLCLLCLLCLYLLCFLCLCCLCLHLPSRFSKMCTSKYPRNTFLKLISGTILKASSFLFSPSLLLAPESHEAERQPFRQVPGCTNSQSQKLNTIEEIKGRILFLRGESPSLLESWDSPQSPHSPSNLLVARMSSWSKADLPLNSAWQGYQQSAPVSLSIQGLLATTAQSHVKHGCSSAESISSDSSLACLGLCFFFPT